MSDRLVTMSKISMDLRQMKNDGVKMVAEHLKHHSHNQNGSDVFGNLELGSTKKV